MITIRPAVEDDAEPLHRIFKTSVQQLAKNHYSPEQITAWSSRRKPKDYLPAIRLHKVWIADVDRKPAGYVQLEIQTGEVQAVFVSPEYARKGVGTELMLFMEQVARKTGLTLLFLRASLNAVPFYQKLGYLETEKIVHRTDDGMEFDCVNMHKAISP